MPSEDKETESGALSVSQAMSIAKKQLESITLKVIGEVSEYSANPRYRAVYFTIKDENSSLPCMMWNNRFNANGAPIQIGSLVEITGRFSLYEKKGRMNFDVFSIELAGEGKLRLQVANLAKKLEAEGLMNAALKKPIPQFPKTIGLVTSPRGAAVYDVLRTLRRRYPSAKVLFAGVGVEGAKAPAEMSDALKTVQDAGAEVILLVRGGGSFEDLMPFNDEGLARTIFSMDVPVITGIGHEPDTSIADMVSDLRASTPTAAAESVAPASSEVLSSIMGKADRMSRILKDRLARTSMILDAISDKTPFSEPQRLFESQARFLDDSLQRITSAIPDALYGYQTRLAYSRAFLKSGLNALCDPFKSDEKLVSAKMIMLAPKLTESQRRKLSTVSASLDALSPLKVLNRGYSIARSDKGIILKSVADVEIDEEIHVQMSDGTLNCNVDSKVKTEYALEDIDGE